MARADRNSGVWALIGHFQHDPARDLAQLSEVIPREQRDPADAVACSKMYRSSLFDRFAKAISRFAGHPVAFVGAAAVIAVWIVSGPVFGFSDTWQLVINTATTIVTFLMVFLIQNSQNRDSAAIQLKLDELIRASRGAHNGLLDLEELSEGELEAFKEKYVSMAEAAREELRRGRSDQGTPQIAFPADE